ncbi:MAG: choice-of-anchor Q domain-containing protein, partial [Planctomycetota bacterium]
ENSIVAGNTNAGSARDIDRGANADITINNSLIGAADNFGTIDGNVGNLTGTTADPLDPLLGELADNGGPTLTHALLPGSPAIDAGDNAKAVDADGNQLVFDQRGEGFDRFSGFASLMVDMGAFEVQVPDELVVSTLADVSDNNFTPGNLSLREAIEIANVRAGSDAITFDDSLSGETILLNGTDLDINDSLI